MEYSFHIHNVLRKSRKFNIRPFGDIQKYAPGWREDLWERWKKDAKDDPNSLIIGLGDYLDLYRPTIQNRITQAFIGDDSAAIQHENLVMDAIKKFAEELKPFSKRIIGLHEGHHFVKLSQSGGITTTQYLCQLLRVKYLGFFAYTRLRIVTNRETTESRSGARIINIVSTHGCGGARTNHGDMAKAERDLGSWWCDLILRGHSTKTWSLDLPAINYVPDLNNNLRELVVKRKKRLVVNCGGFLEGYTEGRTSYVEQGNMPPILLGWNVISIELPSSGDEPVRMYATPYTE